MVYFVFTFEWYKQKPTLKAHYESLQEAEKSFENTNKWSAILVNGDGNKVLKEIRGKGSFDELRRYICFELNTTYDELFGGEAPS